MKTISMLVETLSHVLSAVNKTAKGVETSIDESFGILNTSLSASRKMTELETISELNEFAKVNNLTPTQKKKLLGD